MRKLIIANCPATVREYNERLQLGGSRLSPKLNLEISRWSRTERDPRKSNFRIEFFGDLREKSNLI